MHLVAFLAVVSLVGANTGGLVSRTRTWGIMGTYFRATVWGHPNQLLDEALEKAFEAVQSIDRKMSTYRPDSEISLLNAMAGKGTPLVVSDDMKTVLTKSLEVGRMSGGRFDVTVGPLIGVWKFDRAWQGEEMTPPKSDDLERAREKVGQQKIRFDPDRRTVDLPTSGMRLDFGGVAKGYALDLAADEVTRIGVHSALLDLGGQFLVVGSDPEGGDWKLGIEDPGSEKGVIATVELPTGSISTTADTERFYVIDGRRYSHVIDPKRGDPSLWSGSVTVWAERGMDADAWSTALFVSGPKEGTTLIKRHPELGAVWISASGEVTVEGKLIGRLTLNKLADLGGDGKRENETREFKDGPPRD